jgi:multiple sugar transport system substrate-binding protein
LIRGWILAFSVALFQCLAPCAAAEPLLFLSTQLTPLPEATMMRQLILKDFPPLVDFEPFDRGVYTSRVVALAAHPRGPVIVGGVQEDFIALYRAGALASVQRTWQRLASREFLPRFTGRGSMGADGTYFVPWMHATYLMAANKRALKYLPRGADLQKLTYDQLREWAAAMYKATGAGKLGFPTGPKGLMARFLQGYLYPSYTGSMTEGFRSPDAVQMWVYLRDLWQYVAPASLVINRMDEPLLNGEVWVAWDHSARLLQAFVQRPDDFIAFPAPIGPRGRGFISVLAGLGMPKGAESAAGDDLIEYLTRPGVQVATMESVGFLPVVRIGSEVQLRAGMRSLLQAAVDQLASPEGILSPVPLLGGDADRSFSLAYLVAFSGIVLRGFPITDVLTVQEKKLLEAMAQVKALPLESRGH